MTRPDRPYRKSRSPSLWSRLLLLLGMLSLVPLGVVVAYFILGDRPGASVQLAAAQPQAAAMAQPSTTTSPAKPPAPPQPPAKTEAIEDWMLVCPADAPNSSKCYIQQQLWTADKQTVVFVWTLRKDDKGVVHSVWRAPTGAVLSRGMIADLGDGKPRTVPFSTCEAKGCFIQAVLTPDYLHGLTASSNVSATISLAGDKPVRFALSSRGLAEALSRLPAQ
ncbi:MAG TPA: invasion associated locus B family protein [Arsenicitalea sp.]|jgi:invasion protein IalB|nr:invasion associated locus B family protein [Arsenicitalea sp.]